MIQVTETTDRLRVSVRDFEHSATKRHGGYLTYTRLYGQLLTMAFSVSSVLTTGQKIYTAAELLVKAPWYMIKPLGCLFRRFTYTAGIVKYSGTNILYFDAKKSVTWSFIGIPVFFYVSGKFSPEEQLELAIGNS